MVFDASGSVLQGAQCGYQFDRVESGVLGLMAFSGGRLFMVLLFAYSALVQLNDPDWYFWLPLYSLACIVNVVHAVQVSRLSKVAASIGALLALFLLLKVVIEGCFQNGKLLLDKLFSLDFERRLVREKMGSFLVLVSMWLELKGGQLPSPKSGRIMINGQTLLVSTSIFLCAAYLIPKLLYNAPYP